nr:MAG: RNA-dependent RNA polymerase [Chemarfal virus 246]
MKLTEVGTRGFAGDYKQFDGTVHSEAQFAFCDIVNEWYGDAYDSENAMVRRVLMSESVYTLSLVGNCFYYVKQGVNSGNPATVIIDSFVNQYYLRCAYRLLMLENGEIDKANMDAYRKYVRSISNGDDNINMVDCNIRDIYNLQTVAEVLEGFGIIYTSADKTKNILECDPIEDISDMTFLKRHFMPDPDYSSLIRSPIDKKTIQELVNWIRESGDDEEAMYENLATSLRFAYHWGPQYYEEHRRKINNGLDAIGKRRLDLPYADLNQKWLAQFHA